MRRRRTDQKSTDGPQMPLGDLLDSWKEIAIYLKRDVRTVQLWEKREGLPVRRHLHTKRGTVFAFTSEVDVWRESRCYQGKQRERTVAMVESPAGFFSSATSPTGRIKLAVLPFRNLGGELEQQSFCDGMTEEIITQLGQLHTEGLGIIACSSVMSYKSTTKSVDRIGRELDTNYILEGSVRRSSNRVRISAQLIQVGDQSNIWAESYERSMADVFAVQCEVARSIARSLEAELLPNQAMEVLWSSTASLAAHQNYLKGRYHLNRRTEQGLKMAIRYFEAAIKQDLNYALAYTGLADSYNLLGFYGAYPTRKALATAKAAAMKAVQLENSLGEAHASLAEVTWLLDWDWVSAEKEYKRAVELSPNYATGHHWYANYLAVMGRQDEAFSEMRRAVKLDPFSIIIKAWMGVMLYYTRQYGQAIKQLRKIVELDPYFVVAHEYLGLAYEQEGMYGQAIEEFERAMRLSNGNATIKGMLGHAYAVAGERVKALRLLDKLKQLSKEKYISPYDMAIIYIGLGETDNAFLWLRKACTERCSWIPMLGVEPRIDSLRSDQRFQKLMRRVGPVPQLKA